MLAKRIHFLFNLRETNEKERKVTKVDSFWPSCTFTSNSDGITWTRWRKGSNVISKYNIFGIFIYNQGSILTLLVYIFYLIALLICNIDHFIIFSLHSFIILLMIILFMYFR